MYQDPTSIPSTHPDPANQSALQHLNAAEFAQLDAILDGMRLRRKATPTWEFCEGFKAALICCRRTIAPTEYWLVLLSVPDPWFNAIQEKRFGDLWTRRWSAVMQALDTKVAALDNAAAYQPEVVDARAAKGGASAPSFGQLWAQGFMAAVKAWPGEWAGSRNKQALGDAIWAVYNMREMWRSLWPRIEAVHKAATPGRNDPCACGSGKKYTKCCGLLAIA